MPSQPKESENAQSRAIFAAAQRVIPGGVNSPVRAFKAVGGDPVVIKRGEGSRVWDVDGNEYIDYIGSWGPLILGHAPSVVVQAICETAAQGVSFGALTEREVIFAEMLCDAVPCLEMVRLVNSGTEAVMSAIRLARAATGRDLVVKFDGGYHGHSDGLLAKAGSGVATQGIPGSPGVPAGFASLTISIPFNDIDALQRVLTTQGDRIACLIGEPVPANMGVVTPNVNYWPTVQRMLKDVGALLIFDEVITGFRLGLAGGQGWTSVVPDLCTMGKIIGGGLPVGAFGGRADLMHLLAPVGPVYQAGTLSGNPLAVAAGMATVRTLQSLPPYAALDRRAGFLATGLAEAAEDAGVPVSINRAGSMLTMFFSENRISDYAGAMRADTTRYAAFFQACLRNGVLLAPSQFEAAFTSTVHDESVINDTIQRARIAFREIA